MDPRPSNRASFFDSAFTGKPRRRILALDGGGIRGVFTIEVLARMEQLLREHAGNPKLVLADHFDLIAGTSTGAIIATFLSWGEPVAAIRHRYLEEARRMFVRAPWWRMSAGWFSERNLSQWLREFLVEEDGSAAMLGTARLRTLLLVVMRNATTGSAWPLTNNPRALYNRRVNEDGSAYPRCNLDIPLWQIVRASAAAPVYFPPERVRLGGRDIEFIDGGITAYNNPALIAYITATQPCYKIGWPAGADRLHLVSIGTGQTRALISERLRRILGIAGLGALVPRGLMDSISREQDMLCRVLGEMTFGAPLDREAAEIHGLKQFTYARYNREFTAEEIKTAEQRFGGKFSLDNLRMSSFLREEGLRFASEVRIEHLV
jgi:hypothetical protein